MDSTVWQIAQRDYKFGKGGNKSLTKATYDAVGAHFRKLWGKEAGWAHSVLFTADLRSFSDRLATKVEVKVKQEDDVPVKMIVASTVAVKRPLEDDNTKAVKKEDLVVQTAETVVTRRRSKRQRR
jgi:N-glycosylase/DNA lyase